MDKSTTNIALILGLVILAFAGYYFYVQTGAGSSIGNLADSQVSENLLQESSLFIQHSQTLQTINLDFSLFEDERFTSLHGFSAKPDDLPKGRPNPFDSLKPVTVTNP